MEHIREKPKWLKVKAPISKGYKETAAIVNSNNLVTVCKEAACPNIGECWEKAHASFMMLGDTCTRSCAFCNIKTGKPGPVDFLEPERIADAVYQMKLLHVVITSVDRDDLEDGGAKQFYNVIKAIRRKTNKTTVEILTPDFQRKKNAIDIIIKAKPDVFNHNLETVPRLYKTVRKGARYFHSLNLLHSVKEKEPKIFTKSGIMVGLGETKEEVYQVMDDLRSANVDFITIGQYLRPTAKHHPVVKYITPSEFKEYKQMAYGKGFLMVSSSPFTRSSYHADDDFKIMQEKRNKAYAQI